MVHLGKHQKYCRKQNQFIEKLFSTFPTHKREGRYYMKKYLLLLAASFITLGSLQAAQADDAWFNRWDRNHDGHWDYNEFRKAHYQYWKLHHDEKRLSDAELRAEFDRRAAAHARYVEANDVRDFHHW